MPDKLQDFYSYLLTEIGFRDDLLKKGWTWIPPKPHLAKYGDFYGHYLLPDGRTAHYNNWMSQLTIYPIGTFDYSK